MASAKRLDLECYNLLIVQYNTATSNIIFLVLILQESRVVGCEKGESGKISYALRITDLWYYSILWRDKSD